MVKSEKYLIIGRMVWKMQPEFAEGLLKISKDAKPLHTDLSDMKKFLKVFCDLKGITKIPPDSTYLKHVFLASMIRVYDPMVFSGIQVANLKRKLRRELSHCLNWSPNSISRSIPVVITRLKVYEDFQQDVNEAYNEFIHYINGNVTT